MDKKSINKLSGDYLNLFSNLSKNNKQVYLSIENIDKSNTINIIENSFISIES